MGCHVMRNFNNVDNLQMSLLGSLYCDAELASDLIDPREKDHVSLPCIGDGVNIIDCKHIDRNLHIQDVGGLDIQSKALTVPVPTIARSIPVIPPMMFNNLPETVPQIVVAIQLKDILTHPPRLVRGAYQYNNKTSVKIDVLSCPIFEGKVVILLMDGIDSLIEPLWQQRNITKIFDAISSMGFFAVTGINFSLFIGECPFAQLLNINKSLASCLELNKRGTVAIPHIYAVNDIQRRKCLDYLRSNSSIKTIIINTQLQSPTRKMSRAMQETVDTINVLLAGTGVTILLHGRKPYGGAFPPEWVNRVFMVSQGSLRRRAIKERAVSRNQNRATI